MKDISGVGKFRYHFCDNLYTRHLMATYIKKLSNGEVRMIDICRFDFVDKWNKPLVRQVMTLLVGKIYQEVCGF